MLVGSLICHSKLNMATCIPASSFFSFATFALLKKSWHVLINYLSVSFPREKLTTNFNRRSPKPLLVFSATTWVFIPFDDDVCGLCMDKVFLVHAENIFQIFDRTVSEELK